MLRKNEVDYNVQYAPILVTVYDRLSHFKQCIESLKACPEAKESVLYIASDAPYRTEDEEKIKLIRSYITGIDGFKKVVPIIRETNVGAVKNATNARDQVYEQYDAIILMEDDVVVGRGFLNFMNQGLIAYRDHPKVLGISGYLPPNIENETDTPFFLNRLAPYGMAYWRNKMQRVEELRNPNFFNKCFKDFNFFKEYEKNSPHIVRALPLIIHGGRTFGDVEIGLVMQSQGLLALYPPRSITKSIGNDGSGLHSGINSELQKQVISHDVYSLDGLNEVEIKLNHDMASKVSKYRRECCVFVLNYALFFANKYIPRYFYFFLILRSLFKRFKSMVCLR